VDNWRTIAVLVACRREGGGGVPSVQKSSPGFS
jgi:hypothetical protein